MVTSQSAIRIILGRILAMSLITMVGNQYISSNQGHQEKTPITKMRPPAGLDLAQHAARVAKLKQACRIGECRKAVAVVVSEELKCSCPLWWEAAMMMSLREPRLVSVSQSPVAVFGGNRTVGFFDEPAKGFVTISDGIRECRVARSSLPAEGSSVGMGRPQYVAGRLGGGFGVLVVAAPTLGSSSLDGIDFASFTEKGEVKWQASIHRCLMPKENIEIVESSNTVVVFSSDRDNRECSIQAFETSSGKSVFWWSTVLLDQ